jgi:hypothetical protein
MELASTLSHPVHCRSRLWRYGRNAVLRDARVVGHLCATRSKPPTRLSIEARYAVGEVAAALDYAHRTVSCTVT